MDCKDESEACLEHDEVPGVLQIHLKDNDGSCIIVTYKGTRCIECGIVRKGDFLYKAREALCTH